MLRSLSRFLSLLLISVLTTITLHSCGDGSSQTARQKVSSRVLDRKAYALGEEHARRIIDISADEDKVQDGLLEIRARMSNIESKLSRQSAVDYERGFTDYIRSNCDSLALILF